MPWYSHGLPYIICLHRRVQEQKVDGNNEGNKQMLSRLTAVCSDWHTNLVEQQKIEDVRDFYRGCLERDRHRDNTKEESSNDKIGTEHNTFQ